MSTHPKRAYTEAAIRGATPLSLVVMLHDAAIRFLREASAAIARHDIEARTRALNQVLAILMELQGSLNFERGGEVAQQLLRFYEVMRARLLEASIKSSREIVDEVLREFCEQREAWRKVEAAETHPSGIPSSSSLANGAPTSGDGASARWSA